jgi:hypothetical protein
MMEVVENILVEMMIFAQCHSTKDIWLLSCCVVSAELPFDQQNKLKFLQSDWFLNQFQNFLVELRTLSRSSLRM